MKIKLILTVVFFLLMAALPLGFMVVTIHNTEETQKESNTNKINEVASLCSDSFCDDAIKAVAILHKTNTTAGNNQTKAGSNNSNSELYNRVESIYNSNGEILTFKNKAVAIPYSQCSNGFTITDNRYPYLEAVASPWDRFSKSYSESLNCEGVSINGLDYLCKKGMSAEEALKWYLPQLLFSTVES